jgi:ATP-binding cassette subfamily C protein LapB
MHLPFSPALREAPIPGTAASTLHPPPEGALEESPAGLPSGLSGSAVQSTMESTSGSAPGNTPGNTPGSTPGSTPPAADDPPAPDALLACLLFAARHLHCPVSEARIRADQIGRGACLTPKDFLLAAEKAGMAVASGRYPLAQVPNGLLPAVALLQDGQAVVLLQRLPQEQGFVLYDPRFGEQPVRRELSALESEYLGHLLALRARHRTAGAEPTPTTPHRHWFWGALANNSWTYTQILMAAALTNFLGLSTALFIMVVYDRVLPNEAIESLIALTIGVGIALLFDFLIKTVRGLFIDRAGQKADLVMARTIFDHLLNMQMSARRGSSGGFANTLREFETLRDFFASATLVAIVDLPFVFLFIAVIYLIGGPLYLIPLLAVPIVLIVGIAIQPFLGRIAQDAFEEGRSKQSVLVEAVNGLETIKATGAAPLIRERWEDSIRHQSTIGQRGRALQQLALNATALTQQAAQVAIVVYGVFLISAGTISMGAVIASVILAGRTLAPLAQVAQTLSRLNQARTSYRAIDQLMQAPSERPAGRHYLSRPHLEGRIELRDVHFRYPDQPQGALHGVSLQIEPGERVALLGRVGSGKSTIARLLLGMYSPESGSVLVDGTDIRQIDPADLRHNIGCVLQESWLFSGSIRQNIAVGGLHPTDADLLAAARLAGADEFIAQHSQGYDRIVAERGEGLSGGQRQLICLARALVATPPILLLDEPTSAMDVQTEQALIQRLSTGLAGQTLVLITHRTSLLELVDRIIILERGRIVADGPKSRILRAGNAAAAAPPDAPPPSRPPRPATSLAEHVAARTSDQRMYR